jgi:hypothetical protein
LKATDKEVGLLFNFGMKLEICRKTFDNSRKKMKNEIYADKMKKKIIIISFIISLLWICLGTLMQISAYPEYNFLGFNYNSFIFNLLYSITFPFNIILFGLMFSDMLSNIYVFIIILQVIKILIYWWLIYKILIKLNLRKSQKSASSAC